MQPSGTAISKMKMEASAATLELSLVSSQWACLKLTPAPFPAYLTVLEVVNTPFLSSKSQAAVICNWSYFMVEREDFGVNTF